MSLDDMRKDQTPLSINPVTGEQQNATRIESSGSRPERINLLEDRLPGNIGWTRGLQDAVIKKKDQISVWARTSGDRALASTESMLAAKARSKESIMGKRADQFGDRERYHTSAIAQLDARSGLWNLPVARSLTGMQVAYHSWREKVNERKGRRADARTERAKMRAERAEEKQRYFDTKVASKVDVVSKRWQTKLDAVRKPREDIDADIVKIEDAIHRNETLIAKIKERADVLQNTRGMDRQERRDGLRNLNKRLAAEEAALTTKRDELARKFKHRMRLSVAEDAAEESINALGSRYESHQSIKVPRQESANGAQEPQEPEADIGWSLRELAESKGNLTMEQIAKVWNEVFRDARLPDGHTTLTAMMKSAFPNRDVPGEPDDSMTVKDLFETFREMHRNSPEFQRIAEQVTRARGAKALDTFIGRLESHIAFSDDIKEL